MEASGNSSSPNHQGAKKKPRQPPRRLTEEHPKPKLRHTDEKSNELSHQGTKPKLPATRNTGSTEIPFVNTSERRSVIEEERYESLFEDCYDSLPTKKRPERRTEILSPAGGIITSAEILNARADQFGWLWRKERMFRSRERYWALLYHKVIYLYLDSKDKEEQEKIDLKQGAAVRLQRDKSRFVITLSDPSGKHDFQAEDANTADSWIKILETKIVELNRK